jgi:Heavy metal binding domain
MKKAILLISILFASATACFAQVKMDTAKKEMKMKMGAKKYTCTMHPEVVKNKPDKCPKCGMKLVPMKMKGKKWI